MIHLKYVVITLCAGLLAGCSSSERAKAANQEKADPQAVKLQGVMHLLHVAARQTGHPPAGLADLDPFQTKWQEAYNSMKSGDFVVLWGTPVNWAMSSKGKDEAGKPELVLAYGKDVPSAGGYVLTSAGKITKMSAAEFVAANCVRGGGVA